MEVPPKHKKGSLVIFDPAVKDIGRIPFVTCSHYKDDYFALHERVDMDSFPSWNDFSGESVAVQRGTACIVVQDNGMPFNLGLLSLENRDIDFHLYTICVKGVFLMAFGCDLHRMADLR